MNKSGKKNKIVRYVSIALIVFIAFYISYRVISMNNATIQTQTALIKTVENAVDTTVFIVRDEQYLNKIDDDKTPVSLISDGERVADNEVICAVFNSREEAEDYKKRLYYESELERYNELLTQEKVNISDIMSYDSKTDDVFEKYIESIRNDSFSEAREYISDFCNKLTSRQSAMGVDVDLNTKISELQSEIDRLKGGEPEFVKSTSTGYYVNSTDGFENLIKYEDVLSVTTGKINELLNSSKKSDGKYTGKIINNFNWYMVCTVDSKDIEGTDVGDNVTVRFLNSASNEEKAEVAAINRESNGKAALVLKCNTVTSKIFPLRKEKVKIITDSMKGYAVSKKALKNVEGTQGVYVLRGKIVTFRQIDIIRTEEDFVLVRTYEDENRILNEQSDSDPNSPKSNIDIYRYIKLYDEVITKGSDLSDGKIIQ